MIINANQEPLLVVGNPKLMAPLDDILLKCPYGVHHLETAREALPCLARQRPYAIIVEPGVDGEALCRQVRASNRLYDVPIFAFLADGSDSRLTRIFANGADDLLLDTFTLVDVSERLKRVHTLIKPLPLRNQTILLAINSGLQSSTLSLGLKLSGYDVILASSSLEIFEILVGTRNLYAAVISLQLPGADDPNLFSQIRTAIHQDNLPILVLAETYPPASQLRRFAEQKISGPVNPLLGAPTLVSAVESFSILQDPSSDASDRLKGRLNLSRIIRSRPIGKGRWMAGTTYNISPKGVFIRTLCPEPPGTRLDVQITSPEIQYVTGTVTWVRNWGEHPPLPAGMGIQLDDPAESEDEIPPPSLFS